MEIRVHAAKVATFHAFTGMESVTRNGSKLRILSKTQILTRCRRVSKLSKETDSLSQHNFDVSEALRRIRLDESLTPDDMRSALDQVLAMVRWCFNMTGL